MAGPLREDTQIHRHESLTGLSQNALIKSTTAKELPGTTGLLIHETMYRLYVHCTNTLIFRIVYCNRAKQLLFVLLALLAEISNVR